jgi:hypothetical protein
MMEPKRVLLLAGGFTVALLLIKLIFEQLHAHDPPAAPSLDTIPEDTSQVGQTSPIPLWFSRTLLEPTPFSHRAPRSRLTVAFSTHTQGQFDLSSVRLCEEAGAVSGWWKGGWVFGRTELN